MKWFDYLMFGIMFVILFFVASYQKCEIDDLYIQVADLQNECLYYEQKIDQMLRINDANIRLLSEGWEQ